MVRLIIDRIEGDFAVCEGPNREIVEIERAKGAAAAASET